MSLINDCTREEELPQGCADSLGDCADRAQATLAGCGQEPGLLLSCPRTCDACPPDYALIEQATRCQDKEVHCSAWAQAGECGSNTNYMMRECPNACGDVGSRMAWMGARVAMQQGCDRPASNTQTGKDEL